MRTQTATSAKGTMEVRFCKRSGGVKGVREAYKPKPERTAGQETDSLGAVDDGCAIEVLTGSLGERALRDCTLLPLWLRAVCSHKACRATY